MDNATLKDMLYRVTEDIITTEFYCEFDKVIYNISDFLIRLRNKNIIMPYSEISMIVSRFRFQGASIDSDMRLIDRMEILYEIGVFGLMINPQMCKKNNIYTQLNFSFTEGMSPFYALYNTLIEDSSEVQVVINPIIQKKYSLQFNTTDLIADYSWDYLANNHIRKKVLIGPDCQ